MSATVIRVTRVGDGSRLGPAHVYKLDTPRTVHRYGKRLRVTFVWVSTASAFGRWETYAFACDRRGKVRDWSPGSTSWDGEPPADAHARVLVAFLA